MAQQDQRISEAINREHARLRNFIRKRVADQGNAEDIPQDVFYELVEAYRMMKPVEQATLLSRKHYAILHLRERLQAIYDEFRKA